MAGVRRGGRPSRASPLPRHPPPGRRQLGLHHGQLASLQALDDLDLLLIEQPLFDDDIVLHSEISRELRTPICLDESIHSLRDAQAAATLWERNNALDRLIINIKPPRVSGFAEAIAIARFCQEKGVRTWIGGMLDSAWGKAMNLNFNGLPEIELPGDHFSPAGPISSRTSPRRHSSPKQASSRSVTASQPASHSTGHASSAWVRWLIGSSCPRREFSCARRARRPWRRS